MDSPMSIWLSQNHFFAGQTITGQVCLDMPNVSAETLTLHFQGIDEITEWRRHVHGKRQYLKRSHKTNQFAKVLLKLQNFNGSTTPSGRVAYPFSLNLPEDLPPSTFMKSSKVRGLQA